MRKAIVLFSGGQDSMTCLMWAKQNFAEVHALSFHYGQRHTIEVDCAIDFCVDHDVAHTIIDLTDAFRVIGGSALTDPSKMIAQTGRLPTSFVPGRNILFLAIAGAFADVQGTNEIVAGMCQTDYSGYPDCREVFRMNMEAAITFGLDRGMTIHAPLMYLTKGETWALADSMGGLETVRLGSHTCYEGDHTTLNAWGYGCAKCPACLLRANGWKDYKEA